MILNLRRYKSLLILLFGLFSVAHQAQETEEYKGKYVINDSIEGVAELNFYKKSKDTLLHGDYKFIKVFELEKDNFKSIEYFGEFEEDKKNNEWVFSQKEFTSNHDYTVEELNLISKTNGKATFVYGNFKEGIATGEWNQLKYAFKNSKPADTLYKTKSNFKEGKLHGAYSSVSKELEVQGYFTNGLIDQKWTFETKEFKEIRVFEEGVLIEVSFEFKNEDGIDQTKVEFIGLDTTYEADDSEENWEEVELSSLYFDIFRKAEIKISNQSEHKYQNSIKKSIQNSNQFIFNSFQGYTNLDGLDIWRAIRGSQKIQLPKVKIRKIKFDRDEVENIEKIQENYNDLTTILKLFLEDEKLDLGKLNFEELNRIEAIFHVYKKRINDLEGIIDIVFSPSFEYLVRDEVLQVNKVRLNFPNTISFDYDGDKLTEDYNFPEVEDQKFNLEFISNLLQSIQKDVSNLKEESEEIYEQLRKQESLSENEEILIEKKNKIKDFFSEDKNEDYTTYHDFFANKTMEAIDKIMSDYSKLDLDVKKEEIENFIDCFDKFIEFNEDLIEFESNVERIDEEFTRVVFNPYLMSDISERVKERIYDAYEDYILPAVLKDLKESLKCESFNDKKENLSILYEAMLEIRNKDTKEEEKRLRRVKDVEKILSILNIELN